MFDEKARHNETAFRRITVMRLNQMKADMDLRTLARIYACGVIEEALFDDIEQLAADEVSDSYRQYRYYWLSDKCSIRIQFVCEGDEDKTTREFRQAHPHENWIYVGPIIYGVKEHPISANTLGDPSWKPDGEDFRKLLVTEAKIAAALLSRRLAK